MMLRLVLPTASLPDAKMGAILEHFSCKSVSFFRMVGIAGRDSKQRT
jgi:hypothetical protein